MSVQVSPPMPVISEESSLKVEVTEDAKVAEAMKGLGVMRPIREKDIVDFWEADSPPTSDQIVKSINTDNIQEKPLWTSRVTPLARKNMTNYFKNEETRSKISPWFFYLLAKHMQLSPVSVQHILMLYTQSIVFRKNSYFEDESDNFTGVFQTANIDPRTWFGALTQLNELPEFYAQIMCDRFDELKTHYSENTVFKVDACGRCECELPDNFHLPLIQHLISQKIFVDVNRTCPAIQYSSFAKQLGYTSKADVAKLISKSTHKSIFF